jgi:hypothetical protein
VAFQLLSGHIMPVGNLERPSGWIKKYLNDRQESEQRNRVQDSKREGNESPANRAHGLRDGEKSFSDITGFPYQSISLMKLC